MCSEQQSISAQAARHAFPERRCPSVSAAVEQREGFGCAIAPAVLEASGSSAILDPADDAFTRCQRAIEEGFEAADAPPTVTQPDASAIAALVVASLEGALIMSRAAKSSLPVRRVGEALTALLDARPIPTGRGVAKAG